MMMARCACFFSLAICLTAPNALAQLNIQSTLSISDPRPVATGAENLENQYGWVITYEDPQWVVPSDTIDVTDEVRRDHLSSLRVLIPRANAFTFQAPKSISGGAELLGLAEQLISINAGVGNPGQYRVFESNGALHIVPIRQGGSRQEFVEPTVLDTEIPIVEKNLDGVSVLEAFCKELSTSSGEQVELGIIPVNTFLHQHWAHKATSMIARDFLTAFLSSMGPGYSWQLFFDPVLRIYALNIHRVSPPH